MIWMRGSRVVSCEAVFRLDQDIPACRPDGVDAAVVVVVAPSRLADPVIGRAEVIVDYLDGQGVNVRVVHACALHPGALWTSLRGPAVGGVIGATGPVVHSSRRHRWLPGFGACSGHRLAMAALVPLAAAVFAAPVAHAGPVGQPGVISDPRPGQAGVVGPVVPEPRTRTIPVGPDGSTPDEKTDTPAPAEMPAPISPAPQVMPEPEAVPEPQIVPEPHVWSEPPTVSRPEMGYEPQVAIEPQVAVEPAQPVVEVYPQTSISDGDAEVQASVAGEDSLHFGGVSVPSPEGMSPEVAHRERDWNDIVVTEAAEVLDQAGLADPGVDAALGVGTEPVPLPVVVAEVEAAVPQPIVEEVAAVVVSEPVADVVETVESHAVQVLNDVLAQWPPTLG